VDSLRRDAIDVARRTSPEERARQTLDLMQTGSTPGSGRGSKVKTEPDALAALGQIAGELTKLEGLLK
jgi:hypothetical protein